MSSFVEPVTTPPAIPAPDGVPRRALARLASVPVLWTAAGIAFLVAAWAIVHSPADLALYAAVFIVFTLPGWPLARRLAGGAASLLVVGPLALLLGYAAGLTLFLVARLAGLSTPLFVLFLCVALAIVLWLGLSARDDGFVSLAATDTRDAVALGLLLLLVVGIVGPVFANVGRPTAEGLAYRAYFIADLFAHMSVLAELVKPGSVPLNPYFPQEALPYYWSFFTLPAVFDSLHHGQGAIGVDRGILLTDLVMAGVYVSVWFVALRSLGLSARASAIALAIGLGASSFEGVYFLWQQVALGRELDAFRFVNVDAITRWNWDLPPVDGLHRLLWYTPQHGMAITLGFVGLVVGARARRPDSVTRGLIDGLLLGVALACSSFNGLLLIGGYAVGEAVLLVRGRFEGWLAWCGARALAAAIVLAFLAVTIALGMIQRSSGELILRWNPHLLKGPLTFIALSFGPALFVGALGFRHFARLAPRAWVGAAALSLICAAVFVYVDVRGHENTYVSFRTGQIWYLVMAMGVAAAIDASRHWSQWQRRALAIVTIVASVAAIPTVALDWYNARDISNVQMSAGGFPWTVHIPPADQAAAAWIDANIRESATVQTDGSVRGRSTWALIPAFARRRLAVGLGLFEPDPRRFDANIRRVRIVFRSPDVGIAYMYCENLRIEYLYVGQAERAQHGDNVDKFARDPARFEAVYQAGGITIYRVRLSITAQRRTA
jgi:hypothetical protein